MTTFLYVSATGRFYKEAAGEFVHIATGYAGAGKGINNVDEEHTPNVGPLPRACYRAGTPRNGPTAHTVPLIPATERDRAAQQGRSGFLIHGDNSRGDRSASRGCIVLAPGIRKTVHAGDLVWVV